MFLSKIVVQKTSYIKGDQQPTFGIHNKILN